MALRMASPYRHPKTGMFWFRRRVPDALRPLLRKTIYQRSLGTKDVAEAKRKFLQVAAAVDREWARLLVEGLPAPDEPPRLTRKQTLGLAGEFYRWFVAGHDEDPGSAEAWRAEVARERPIIYPRGPRPGGATRLYQPLVVRFLKERGIVIDEADLMTLTSAAATAALLAKERLARIASSDYSDDPAVQRFPKWEEVEPKLRMPARMLTVEEHFDAYGKTKAASTRKKYRACLGDLARFLGTKDLGTLTTDRLVAWIEDLAKRGLDSRSIAHGHLSAVRSFFAWAIRNRKASRNPTLGVGVDIAEKTRSRKPYFTDDEATLILSEAQRPAHGAASKELVAARRWVPWICAYTGARVNEITQLRGQDVSKHRLGAEDVWVIRITPEAGPVKTRRAREVPLHPHLIRQGFARFVEKRGQGPLFYDPERRRGGSDENPQSRKVGDKLAEWVRKIGVDDPGVQPNHGWRHRFNVVARRVRMVPEIRDAIKGHKPRTEGEEYGGDVEWDVMWPEIKLLPRYNAKAPTEPIVHTPARAKATRDRAATRKRAKAKGSVAEASGDVSE
jgi:integrase